jgi:hypothetical protein
MTARRWTDLAPQERRRQTAKTGLAILLGWTVILGIYYLVPFTNRVGSTAILRLGSGIALFGAVLAWEIRRVALHDLPELRAVRALGITIPVFLIAFAGVYLSLSHASASHFSEPLNHTARSTSRSPSSRRSASATSRRRATSPGSWSPSRCCSTW